MKINNSSKKLSSVSSPRKRSATSKKNRKSYSRKILKLSDSPSLNDDSGYDLPNKSVYHANHRIILFYLDCVHRYSEAVRSNGEKIDVKTWIGPTSMQGDRSKEEAHHGSHCNTGAVYDNLYIEHIKIAKEEEEITPQKKKHFEQIGFSENEIKIIAHPKKDPKAYKAIVTRVNKFRSYISHTVFEQSMNMTVSLPRDSNLMIDKSIENDVRSNFLTETMKKVMLGEMNPVTATRKYIKAIRKSLKTLSKTLKAFEAVFVETFDTIKVCIDIESKHSLKKMDEVDAETYYESVKKVKQGLIDLKKKSDTVVKFGLSDLKRVVQSLLPRTRKKIDISNYIKRTNTLWRRSVGFSLNKDSYQQLISVQSRIDQMHVMIAKQLAGTVEPDYKGLLNLEGGGKNKTESDVKKRLVFN